MGKDSPNTGIKTEALVHCLITGGTADRQARNALPLAPRLRRSCQLPGNAFFSEYGFNIEIIKSSRICTRKRGPVP